jgi:hypothetical protein
MNLFQRLTALIRRYPLVTICLVLIAALGTASYLLWQSQQELTGDHERVRRDGEDVLLSLSGLPRVTAEYTTVKEAVDFIEANLIKEGELAENLGYFYQLETASRARLTQLSQLSSQPAPADAPFVAIPFSIRAVMRFLHELESGPRVCRITNYSLSGDGDDRVQIDLGIEMLGRP